jgi:hypothetical protein
VGGAIDAALVPAVAAVAARLSELAGAAALVPWQVRETPSWPRSWANFSLS